MGRMMGVRIALIAAAVAVVAVVGTLVFVMTRPVSPEAVGVSGTAHAAALPISRPGAKTSQPRSNVASSANSAGPVQGSSPTWDYSVRVSTVTRNTAQEQRSYPRFSIVAAAGGLPAGSADRATTALNSRVAAVLAQFDQVGTANDYGDQQWTAQVSVHNPGADPSRAVQQNRYLELGLMLEGSYGGETDQQPFTVLVDMSTGTQVGLDQIIDGGDTAELRQIVLPQVKAGAADPADLSEDELRQTLDAGGWAVDQDGLHVLTPSGMLGSVADGPGDVVVPWSTLTDVTTPLAKSEW
jgi:hypothetical protein